MTLVVHFGLIFLICEMRIWTVEWTDNMLTGETDTENQSNAAGVCVCAGVYMYSTTSAVFYHLLSIGLLLSWNFTS